MFMQIKRIYFFSLAFSHPLFVLFDNTFRNLFVFRSFCRIWFLLVWLLYYNIKISILWNFWTILFGEFTIPVVAQSPFFPSLHYFVYFVSLGHSLYHQDKSKSTFIHTKAMTIFESILTVTSNSYDDENDNNNNHNNIIFIMNINFSLFTWDPHLSCVSLMCFSCDSDWYCSLLSKKKKILHEKYSQTNSSCQALRFPFFALKICVWNEKNFRKRTSILCSFIEVAYICNEFPLRLDSVDYYRWYDEKPIIFH